MTHDPIAAAPDASAARVLELMIHQRISHVPVVDESGRLLGLVTGHQVRRIELDGSLGNCPVRKIMLIEPVTTTADTTVGAAMRIMSERRVSSLLVVDSAGRLEGIITRQDLLNVVCRWLAFDQQGSTIELSLVDEKADLVAAFEVLKSHDADLLSAVASCVRDDGDEPALYLRIAQRNPRPIESALSRAGLIPLEPELEAERSDEADRVHQPG